MAAYRAEFSGLRPKREFREGQRHPAIARRLEVEERKGHSIEDQSVDFDRLDIAGDHGLARGLVVHPGAVLLQVQKRRRAETAVGEPRDAAQCLCWMSSTMSASAMGSIEP